MLVVPALNLESSAGGGPWLLPCQTGLWARVDEAPLHCPVPWPLTVDAHIE